MSEKFTQSHLFGQQNTPYFSFKKPKKKNVVFTEPVKYEEKMVKKIPEESAHSPLTPKLDKFSSIG